VLRLSDRWPPPANAGPEPPVQNALDELISLLDLEDLEVNLFRATHLMQVRPTSLAGVSLAPKRWCNVF
jgi:hypothetical protein